MKGKLKFDIYFLILIMFPVYSVYIYSEVRLFTNVCSMDVDENIKIESNSSIFSCF